MSAVYRQSSTEDPAKWGKTPPTGYSGAKAPLRLEAEVIRDSMLKVSGLLQTEMFGPQQPLKRGSDGQSVVDKRRAIPIVAVFIYPMDARGRRDFSELSIALT